MKQKSNITKYRINKGCIGLLCGLLLYGFIVTMPDAPAPITRLEVIDTNKASFLNGDETEILASNEQNLRILFHRKFQDGFGIDEIERSLVEDFAKENSLNPVWIEVDERWQLLPAMYQGKGDIIVSQGYDLAGGLEGVISFTDPWAKSKQQIVTRNNHKLIKSLDHLKVRQVAIKSSSTIYYQLKNLAENNPSMDLLELDSTVSEESILKRLESGQYDAAVMDSDYLKHNLSRFPSLKTALDLTDAKHNAWAVSKSNNKLRQNLNEFLNKELLTLYEEETHFGDLPGLLEKGSLRAITYQSPTNVFYKDGELKGFEYELIKRFADEHKLQLNIVFANSQEEMYQLLMDGKGDVITASIPTSNKRPETVSESVAYSYSAPVLIGRKNSVNPIDIFDLNGRSVSVPAESPYLEEIKELRKKYDLDLTIKEVESTINTETLLFLVSLDIHDLTIIPSHNVKVELSRQVNLQASLYLSEPDKTVWITREENSVLRESLDVYITSNYRQLEFNSLKQQYITEPKIFNGDSRLLTRVYKLTPYDETIRKYADQYGFDWRLIAAQMYQESQFDPVATSDVGAEGLMQIMPRTANELGLEESENPVDNIEAGIRYLSYLKAQFDDDLLLMDRTWFALAAYNAGYRRVSDARKQAEQLGLDSNKWFGNVEIAMKEMAKKKSVKDNTRICRCGQTVVYVRDIRTRYKNYVGLTDATDVAAHRRPISQPNIVIASSSL